MVSSQSHPPSSTLLHTDMNVNGKLLFYETGFNSTITGPSSPPHQSLLNTTKSPLCAVILGTASRTIETIQALLIDACYSEKGWLLTSMALKIALELNLPESYGRLSGLVLGGAGGTDGSGEMGRDRGREEERLLRESRVWFGVWVLEHM
jgi:hypothetical protein